MNYLLSFDSFITGSGIWILVGCLGFALLVSIIFLVLNIEKEKRKMQNGNTPVVLPSLEEKPVVAEEKPVVEEKEVKAVEAEKEEKVEEPVKEEKVAEKKPAAKKAPAKKAAAPAKAEEKPVAKAPAKKVASEPIKEEKESASEDYVVSYDFESKDWVVRKGNSQRATKRTKTKQQAIDFAKPLAEKNEVKLIVHNKNEN